MKERKDWNHLDASASDLESGRVLSKFEACWFVEMESH